jgi:hypothetical protein
MSFEVAYRSGTLVKQLYYDSTIPLTAVSMTGYLSSMSFVGVGTVIYFVLGIRYKS